MFDLRLQSLIREDYCNEVGRLGRVFETTCSVPQSAADTQQKSEFVMIGFPKIF